MAYQTAMVTQPNLGTRLPYPALWNAVRLHFLAQPQRIMDRQTQQQTHPQANSAPTSENRKSMHRAILSIPQSSSAPAPLSSTPE